MCQGALLLDCSKAQMDEFPIQWALEAQGPHIFDTGDTAVATALITRLLNFYFKV